MSKAIYTVHWPSGPVNACDQHAREIIGLGRFMGAHIIATPFDGDEECVNCKRMVSEGVFNAVEPESPSHDN